MDTQKAPYAPKLRSFYNPTEDSVESGTGVEFPVNMPSPDVDDIAVNNIAWQEFDYTEDMLPQEDSDVNSEKVEKNSNNKS